MIRKLIFSFSFILWLPAICIAQNASTITILDVNGEPKIVTELDATIAAGVVEATLAFEAPQLQKPDGFAVVLTNKLNGEKLSRTVVDGLVRFSYVPEGIWTISSTRNGVIFTSLRIEDPAPFAAESAVAGAVAGKAAAAGASVLVPGILIGKDSSSSENGRPPLSPSD